MYHPAIPTGVRMTDSGNLLAVSKQQYGAQYETDFMTLFRDYVESAHQISRLRHQANTFFSSINTVLLMATGLVPSAVTDSTEDTGTNWQVALAGVLLCLIWRRMIIAYSDLNSAKFKVINEIEEHLPLAAYKKEWQHFKTAGGRSLTSVESWVPRLFMGAYIAVTLVNFWASR
jgi:hypothetical protein